MSEATVIRSPQDFLKALKTIRTNPPAIPAVAQPEAPLTLEQVNEKIAEFSLALESPLPDPVREEIERRRAALVMEQFRLRHGYIPDAEGNNPADVKAIVDVATEAATKSVIDTLAAAPESSSELESGPEDEEEETEEDEELFDLDEQAELLNELDESDAEAVAVPMASPVAIPTPTPAYQIATDGIFLEPDICTALRASVVAGLPHLTAKITATIVDLVLGRK